MNDAFWLEVAEAVNKLPQLRRVVGPKGLEQKISSVTYYSYDQYDDTWRPDCWILHRGMSNEWPERICTKLKKRQYAITWSNEVFSVVKTRLIAWPPKMPLGGDANHIRSLNKIIDSLQPRQTFKTKSANEQSFAEFPHKITRYALDSLIRRLIDVKGWESATSPNTSATGELARDLQIMKANIKTLAWQLERLQSPPKLEQLPITQAVAANPDPVQATCRLCSSEDIYSPWHRQLSASLRSNNYKLRKIWEWTYTIQVLYDQGFLSSGSSGLGFGCGTEPLASCFSNFVAELLITDAPPHIIEGKGWSDTNQHTANLEQAKHDWLAPRECMDKVMRFEFADMNNISHDYFNQFNFVWSSCALEHLGSKHLGLTFIVQSAQCLKPGGIAVHTTEYDLSGQSTIDNWETVLFNEDDFLITLKGMLDTLNNDGSGRHFELCPFDLRRGTAFLDGYVDIPPYGYHKGLNDSFKPSPSPSQNEEPSAEADYPYPQTNLSVDGFPCTSIAILVKRTS